MGADMQRHAFRAYASNPCGTRVSSATGACSELRVRSFVRVELTNVDSERIVFRVNDDEPCLMRWVSIYISITLAQSSSSRTGSLNWVRCCYNVDVDCWMLAFNLRLLWGCSWSICFL